MKVPVVMVLLSFAGRAQAGDTLFKVPWGSSEGQIGFYNKNNVKVFDQPYAEGPAAIAEGPGGEVWISDQFNDRILRFKRDGTTTGTLTALKGVKLSRPQVLWVDGDRQVAVLNTLERKILWLDQRTGTLRQLEGPSTGGRFNQIELLTGSEKVGLLAGDFGQSALFHFAPDGEFVEKRRWGLSGAALDRNGGILTVEYLERSPGRGEKLLVTTSPEGDPRTLFPVSIPELETPYVIGKDTEGRALLRYVKPGKEKRFVVVRYDSSGAEKKVLGETPVTVSPQTFALDASGAVLTLSFDADRAPEGMVEVRLFR